MNGINPLVHSNAIPCFQHRQRGAGQPRACTSTEARSRSHRAHSRCKTLIYPVERGALGLGDKEHDAKLAQENASTINNEFLMCLL